MDNKVVSSTKDPQLNTPEDPKSESWGQQFKCFAWGLAGVAFIVLVFFMWKQDYGLSYPIASDIWGQYGDFIGGVLGTIVAFISLKFLVETLKEQRDANLKINNSNVDLQENNERNSKIYELQQFDSTFHSLLSLYRESISAYKVDGKGAGHESLKLIFDSIYEGYSNTSNYPSKVRTASRCFDRLYAENRECMSVHLRVLYQLCKFISEAKIPSKEKVLYSKIVRSLLSEQELLLIRYNCLNQYGYKMRQYVNEFNLLKHLPLTRLLEFSEWNSLFSDSYKSNVLDTEFINVKKLIKEIFQDSGNNVVEKSIQYSRRYSLHIKRSGDKRSLSIELDRISKQKGDKAVVSFEKAFDGLSDEQIEKMLRAFMYDTIQYSNFDNYNHKKDLTYSHQVNLNGNESRIEVSVRKETPLIVYYHQQPNA